MTAFNTEHPLLGGEPIDVLVTQREHRRKSTMVTTRLCNYSLPSDSFLKLREGLYVTSPELTFARLGYGRSEAQIARIGMELCARYYIDVDTGSIRNRAAFLTTPARLHGYLETVPRMHGSSKAIRAMKWVLPNSGSPAETQTALQLSRPLRYGGFGLAFDALNYDIEVGRRSRIAEQGAYCIDAVNLKSRVGVEYDGEKYHLDASADKRRRNALAALGWSIFPIDKNVLHDPDATDRFAHQVAKAFGARIQKPPRWEQRYLELRRDLGLPV